MRGSKELINELLVEVFNHILAIESDSLRKKGINDLSMTEIHTLEAIQNSEIPIMTNVAKKLRITVGTLTIAVNGLVRKKYVERMKDLHDKRKVHLRLTERGQEALIIHDEFHNEMISALLKETDIDQDEVLLKSLENIVEYFKNKY